MVQCLTFGLWIRLPSQPIPSVLMQLKLSCVMGIWSSWFRAAMWRSSPLAAAVRQQVRPSAPPRVPRDVAGSAPHFLQNAFHKAWTVFSVEFRHKISDNFATMTDMVQWPVYKSANSCNRWPFWLSDFLSHHWVGQTSLEVPDAHISESKIWPNNDGSYMSYMGRGLCLVGIPFPINPQQDLMTAGQRQQPSAIFSCLWRYAERFQPTAVDLDAALNALAKCTRRPCRLVMWVSWRLKRKTKKLPTHSSHPFIPSEIRLPDLGTPERSLSPCSIGWRVTRVGLQVRNQLLEFASSFSVSLRSYGGDWVNANLGLLCFICPSSHMKHRHR